MLPRLVLLNQNKLLRYRKWAPFGRLAGALAISASIQGIASAKDGDGIDFAIRQAAEAQKGIDKLIAQDNDISLLSKNASSTSEHTQNSIKDMKAKLSEVKTQAHQLINRGDLIEGISKKTGCPSKLFAKQGDHLRNCESKAGQSVSLSQEPQAFSREEKSQLLVFVSFSLPEISLKKLAQTASKHNAILVMRGLFENSFVKTARKLEELGVTVEINPELFETHQVTSVPTFISLNKREPTSQLRGNVTLEFVAKKFEEVSRQEQLSKVAS